MTSQLVQAVVECVTQSLGFSEQALELCQLEAAVSALRQSGRPQGELLAACRAREPAVLEALCAALTAEKIAFFRFPEHFARIERELAPALLRTGISQIRVWSAGCGEGAEAYALAACLLACLPPRVTLRVLGTDLVRERVETARRGSYDPDQVRSSGPLLFPALRREGTRLVATDAVRAAVDFRVHNLLDDPPDPAHFELVVCRKVLGYLNPQARRRVSTNLRRALAAHGTLLVGPSDPLAPTSVPPRRATPAGVALPVLRLRASRAWAPSVGSPTALAKITAPDEKVDALAVHLDALANIERGNYERALALLDRLLGVERSYLPGLTERAWLLSRLGKEPEAVTEMVDVLRRVEHMPRESIVRGPRPLPVSFYRDSARSFLRSRGRAP